MKKIVLLISFIVIVWFYGLPAREIKQAPGVQAPAMPQQTAGSGATISYKDYTITPLADFDITARVLSKQDYYLDTAAGLSPTDLALGWGPMSDTQVLEKISISQSGRWYLWHVDEFPIPQREIETHSANMHMIPANASVANTLKHVRKGNIIYLKGKLVSVNGADGWHWQSSLTREDTGDGACEVIWVEDFYIKG